MTFSAASRHSREGGKPAGVTLQSQILALGARLRGHDKTERNCAAPSIDVEKLVQIEECQAKIGQGSRLFAGRCVEKLGCQFLFFRRRLP